MQYRADLTTTDPSITPELQDIIISTDHAPVAVNDAATTPENTPYTFAAAGSTSLKANDSDVDTPFAQLRVIAVSVPGLPGCHSQGDTEREALDNIADAIREYLAAIEDLTRESNARTAEVEV